MGVETTVQPHNEILPLVRPKDLARPSDRLGVVCAPQLQMTISRTDTFSPAESKVSPI
ncbi:hypothetical protein SERLA73DRAFT_182793 [Serpula lacrymans var. lacrymans S7.3]|uniref:Uncharacterized protein n=2 Tax=Serpula lacrymans var. lacrymans TaxID=341189 RepID=F8Q105_SERL3|nr:uncharacterized protein SERLADRAFT_469621 [Serpula lacrymans var. lacrymans S7.9]EGN97983.1 hypothetical protein SERLA73DRAFT_182793 [Serpula lacrymans var. lacrymans S7.3]EGO23574.1 hypothetical protein SERLADRAFT_469621 [Serpula lacrymans var. lacrymans S7.9]